MTISGYKRIAIGLAVVVVLLVAFSGKLFWDYSLLDIRTELAREQIEIFDDMRDRALGSGVAEAADCLRYAVHYYPSGTKQVTGSRLDRIVERERGEVVRAIIAHLRNKSGEDLGDDPEKWVEKYGKK
jgi:hypothetical protein